MTMIKRGNSSGGSVISCGCLYKCSSCGQTDVSVPNGSEPVKCPACGESMYISSYSSQDGKEGQLKDEA